MRLGETYIVARNVVRVFADSSRLGDILEAGEIVSRRHFEAEAARLRMTASGRRFLSERRELHSSDVDQTKLRALPVGTVGRAYIDHLDRHGLSMDAICAPAVQPGDSDARYLLRRFRGNHDIWHALLDLGIAGHEEVLVHAFSWGQLRLPQSALVVFFGGIKHVVGERRWHVLRHDIARYAALGRRAASLLEERWEDCWDEPLVSARARLGLDDLELNRSCAPGTRVEHIAKSSDLRSRQRR